MARGETRAKLKKLTLTAKHGLEHFGHSTAEAFMKPSLIPEKLERCVDNCIVQPVTRTVDFFDDSLHHSHPTHDKDGRGKGHGGGFGRRLRVVFQRPLASGDGAHAHYPKSDADAALLRRALDENVVFHGLSESKREWLHGAFEPVVVEKGATIYAEGDEGDYFYVIGSGTVTFRVAGNEVGHLEAGSSFGEQALLYSSPRAATAVARTKCGLFRLDQGTFRGLFQKLMKESHAKVLATLRKVLLFKDLDESYLNKISYNLKVFKYHDGEVLVKQGDPRRLFVIQEGKVDIDVGEGSSLKLGGADYKLVAQTMEAGKCFGEYAIMEDKWGFKTATAVGDVEALSIDREQFMKVLGGDLQGLIKKSLDKKKLVSVASGNRAWTAKGGGRARGPNSRCGLRPNKPQERGANSKHLGGNAGEQSNVATAAASGPAPLQFGRLSHRGLDPSPRRRLCLGTSCPLVA